MMNGSGCKSCPVKPCETMSYRGSTCAAQRAKYGLGDPMTNADRIRAMNDKKIAVFLCEHGACSFKTCPGSELCNGSDGKANGILKWLQQPSEGE